MNLPLALAAVLSIPVFLGIPGITSGLAQDVGQGGGAVTRPSPSVVLVKRQGVRAFQDVAEAFSEHCRVQVQQIQIDDGPNAMVRAREQVQSARVLVAVGQPAVDAVVGVRAHIVYALAPDPPAGAIGTNSSAPPAAIFRALLQVLPRAKRIAVPYSSRGAARVAYARAAARALNLDLIELPVRTSPDAIRTLSALLSTPPQPGIDAIWVGADPQLIDTQVFLFLREVQLRWQVPVLAATRQQVSFGALLTVDWSPEQVGRNLAYQVNHLLEDPERLDALTRDHPATPPEVVVNRPAALRMGLPVDVLRTLPGWKVID